MKASSVCIVNNLMEDVAMIPAPSLSSVPLLKIVKLCLKERKRTENHWYRIHSGGIMFIIG